MEITLLLEATENAFRIMEKARKHAVGLMDTAVEFTAEETRYSHQKRIQALFSSTMAGPRTFCPTFMRAPSYTDTVTHLPPV